MSDYNTRSDHEGPWSKVIDYHHQSTSSNLPSQFHASRYNTPANVPPVRTGFNQPQQYQSSNFSGSTNPSTQFSSSNLATAPKTSFHQQLQLSNAPSQRSQLSNFSGKTNPSSQFNSPNLAPTAKTGFHQQLQPSNSNQPSQQSQSSNFSGKSTPYSRFSSSNSPVAVKKDNPHFSKKYDPFVEDNVDDQMEISDDEKPPEKSSEQAVVKAVKAKQDCSSPIQENVEVKSGAAFYKGLILYIPPFEQISNTYRGSPAMKMLYASFEFSFKKPIRIETKPRKDSAEIMEASVYYEDHLISTGSGWAPHVEASVRALELLSETCYTIQAKEDYFVKCKLVDAENMKTLNLKRWEMVCQKYPKLLEITKESHVQKTFALFLDSHTSSNVYEDIVCCNLTRGDVNNIKAVVEFFHLTMLPCSVTTNLTKKSTPCVVSIHKYTSAQKLLDILVACGGENDKFTLFPPDTFKDFYKLHQNFWDQSVKNADNKKSVESQTTLDDEELQGLILKPYENIISELFEKHKTLPKKTAKQSVEDSVMRKVGDDFMKEKLQIDIAHSKSVAPVQRMQLLLKYMEQLQEYGSRVLTSGRPEMIKIYHNAIDNLRKDLDQCRKDIEKDQKSSRSTEKSRRSRTPPRKRSPARSSVRSKSLERRSRRASPPHRPRRSPSPRRKPRSRSPRRRPVRHSPPRRARSPPKRQRTPSPHKVRAIENSVMTTIFEDQFKRFLSSLRRLRIEIEDTPIEQRKSFLNKVVSFKEQLIKYHKEAIENPRKLETFYDDIEICREEIQEQLEMVMGKLCPSDLPRSITPPPWMNVKRFDTDTTNAAVSYPLPVPRPLMAIAPFRPPATLPYRYPY